MLLHTLFEHWFKNAEFSTCKLIVYILFFILTIKLILMQSGICRHWSFFQFILIFILGQAYVTCNVTYIQDGKYHPAPKNFMKTSIRELKEIILNLQEEIKEIKEIKQEIGKIKIELSIIQKSQKKNKKVERLDIIKSGIIGTSFKKPTQKPQKGSYDFWFMETQYPKILKESEELKADIKKKDKGKEKIEIKEQTPSESNSG